MTEKKPREPMTHEEWEAKGRGLFGEDMMKWRFRCPVCSYVCSVQDWKDAGAAEGEAAFSCIGRHRMGARRAFEEPGSGPCNYAGGGLFRLNPVLVRQGDDVHQVFEFAEPELEPKPAA